jgi:two-component system, OmpR family, sensor histidine kinase BaeS
VPWSASRDEPAQEDRARPEETPLRGDGVRDRLSAGEGLRCSFSAGSASAPRLAVALTATAILAVAIATLLSNLGLPGRVAEAAEARLERQAHHLAAVAAALRTPVNGLLGRIEAAQDNVLEPSTNLAAMHAETLRLTRLLDDLSRLSDAQRPGLLLEKEHVQLHDLAVAAVDRWRSRAPGREIALEVDASRATVRGDAGRLTQVLANLIGNAVAHSGGDARVRVRTATLGDEVLLEVSDTGRGIAADDLPHVFGRFWRAERSRSPQTGGVGIGLTIARELVRAHDGVIEAESVPGEQTTFRVILPADAVGARAGAVHNSSTLAWHALARKER